MAEELPKETLLEKMADKIKRHDSSSSSSSSDSDNDDKKVLKKVDDKIEVVKNKVFRIFGREKPVHTVLGAGKPADIVLWRNKKVTAGVFSAVTAVWVVFVLLEYFLLTFVCHCLILALSMLFLWANVSSFINKSSSPHIPDVHIPEDVVVNTALCLRNDINRALHVLRDIASGKDLKKFLGVIAGLWFLSIIGSSCNFLTLFYIIFVLLHTVPLLYEKYDDKVDAFAEKVTIEIKKQYAVLDAKVLCKIPVGPWKEKKH